MKLSARILNNIANVNQWELADTANLQEGQTNEFHLQLIDQDKDLASGCFMRYMSTATVIAVEATFPALDDDEVLTIAATQPFTQDKSIWKISLSSSQLPKPGDFQIKLTEDGVDRFFKVKASIQVELLNDGAC